MKDLSEIRRELGDVGELINNQLSFLMEAIEGQFKKMMDGTLSTDAYIADTWTMFQLVRGVGWNATAQMTVILSEFGQHSEEQASKYSAA